MPAIRLSIAMFRAGMNIANTEDANGITCDPLRCSTVVTNQNGPGTWSTIGANEIAGVGWW